VLGTGLGTGALSAAVERPYARPAGAAGTHTLEAPPTGGEDVAACEVCGNDYDKAFEIHAFGDVHTFDSFECAIHRMAPICEHCGVKVIGHGVESDGQFFCCAHCARMQGEGDQFADRA
jgi:hypothetical protein